MLKISSDTSPLQPHKLYPSTTAPEVGFSKAQVLPHLTVPAELGSAGDVSLNKLGQVATE